MNKKYEDEYTEAQITHFIGIISQIAMGDLSVRAKYEHKDDFSALAMGINMMIEEIKERDTELEKSFEERIKAEKAVASAAKARLEEAEKVRKIIEERAKKLEASRSAMIYMLRDIDKTSKELETAKDYTDNIIKSMIDTLIVVNPDASIRTVNQATLELLGYSEDELIGQPVGIIFEEEEEEEEEELLFKGTRLEKLLKEGSVKDYDMTYLTKDKERIPVSFSGSVMRKPRTGADKDTDKHGEIIGIVGVARDMREIKEYQAKLIHTSKLEAVGTLSSNIAHTIGNMMATLVASSSGNREEITKLKCIQSLDELFENSQTFNEVYEEYHKTKLGSREEFRNLRSKYIRQIDDLFEQSIDINETRQKYKEIRKEMLSTAYSRIYSYSEEMLRQTNLMSENIKNLLYFARTHKPEQRKVNLNEILNTARSLLSAYEKIEFIENCAPDLPVIIADGNQLLDVFMNIMLNGIEAMPEGGKLTYGTRVIGNTGFSDGSDDQQVEVYISNTGTGIPEENINKIFTPFFSTKEKGSGLGLSRVRDIIERYNGKIDVKSNAKGTIFTIKLPTGDKWRKQRY